MPKRKRNTNDDPDDEQPVPRKSTRLALAANTVSAKDPGSNRSSGEKSLSSAALVKKVLKMAENENQAELMILELMREYSFSFHRLKELLRQNNLDVSFSKVQYVDIAPMVGLKPNVKGSDIPLFDMFRARLPNDIFYKIVEDLQAFAAQYGPMDEHENEEARARYLSGYFNKIVALFSGHLFNTPETLLEGKLTTKGRIEYQFTTYGGITVVFIEIKLDIGSLTERLNCFAQVIAECDACAWMNDQNGYQIPIMAVLCDGKKFYFFQFLNQRQANGSPQISLGEFANGLTDIQLIRSTDPEIFYQQIRNTCESLYYVFLSGYLSGLEAYWNFSVERGKAEGKGRDSTPGWHKAKVQAKKALKEAMSAWDLCNEGKLTESKESAERAAQFLAESIEEAPLRKKILPDYKEEMTDKVLEARFS